VARKSALAATAHHEAGHAVVAWLQQMPLVRAHVVPDDRILGGVRRGNEHYDAIEGDGWIARDESANDPAERARVCVAGFLAERRFTGRGNRRGASSDFEHFDECLRLFVPEARPYWEDLRAAYRKLFTAQTRGMIDTHWSLVEALAGALVERRDMTGDDVVSVLRHARGEDQPAEY